MLSTFRSVQQHTDTTGWEITATTSKVTDTSPPLDISYNSTVNKSSENRVKSFDDCIMVLSVVDEETKGEAINTPIIQYPKCECTLVCCSRVVKDGTPFLSTFSSRLVVNKEHPKNYKTVSSRLP